MTIMIQVADLSELEPIRHWLALQDVRIALEQPYSQPLSTSQEIRSRSIVEKGADVSYFGDAAEWQRQQRQDRDLPF